MMLRFSLLLLLALAGVRHGPAAPLASDPVQASRSGNPATPVGQLSATSAQPVLETPDLPFAVGERAQYRASYSMVGRVGTGVLEVTARDTLRGHTVYRLLLTLQARFLFASVNNRWESWLDRDSIFSHRFVQNTHEIRFRRVRTREFFPNELRWTGATNDRAESGELITSLPLDDVSFIYFVRTLSLEVGQEYELTRYWNPRGNPVRLQVLRRETVTVPAGTFQTIVVRPIIRTSGLFAEDGEAEVYLSEQGERPLVMLRAKVSFGSLQLQLEKFEPGSRVALQPHPPLATGDHRQ